MEKRPGLEAALYQPLHMADSYLLNVLGAPEP